MKEIKYRLPRIFADKWLTALRSGKYKQGSGALKSERNEYCCLGVAAEIAGLSISTDEDEEEPYFITIEQFPNMDSCIPHDLQGNCNLPTLLAHMNDGTSGYTQHSFCEIADWIETNVELYDEVSSN